MVPYGSPEEIGVIQLAWLGDSVWELHQRLRYVHFPLKSKELHLSVVNEVPLILKGNEHASIFGEVPIPNHLAKQAE